MGVNDRVIILIDMDCFFCQVEENCNPKLKGEPIAVLQYNAWRGGGIIAVNYPARDQGVTRHMRGKEAQEKCPTIKLVQVPEQRGKADLTRYREAGKRVADILATFTPLLERASIDEAYLDITDQVNHRIRQNDLKDLSCENMQNTFVIGCEINDFIINSKLNQDFSEDNLKLAIGGLIAENIRREVFIKTGYTCSAGIAHNKILSKLVCGLHKPNKQTILPQEGVSELFKTMPIRKIRSLGGKFGQTLSEDFGITFMGELARFSEREFAKKYDDKTANWLYNIARGVEFEPVTTKLISKSIGCCKNFPGRTSLRTSDDVKHWLSKLADELSERLEKDLQENNRRAKSIIISFTQEIKKNDVTSSKTQPLTSYNSHQIMQIAFEIINKFCLRSDKTYHVKFMGFSAGHFEDIKKVREITSFFKTNPTKCSPASSSLVRENNDDLSTLEEDNVFLQKTQELEEKIGKEQFYDDNCRIKDNAGQIEENEISAKSSFFLKYFKCKINAPQKSVFEESTSEEQIPDSSPEEPTEFCANCQKRVKISEMESHKDYHFALNLVDSENIKPALQAECKLRQKINKRKKLSNEDNKMMMSFIQKIPFNDLEDVEECQQCRKRIKREDIKSHLDYHIAKKLHLELNPVIKNAQNTSNNFKNNKTSKKIPSSSVASFFKPL